MALQTIEQYTPDNLFAASSIFPVVASSLEIAKGQELKIGSLLDEDGNLMTSGDDEGGTSIPYAVLAEAVDTTDEAKVAPVYLTGEFNKESLIVADGEDIEDFVKSARSNCIFIK